MQSKEELLFEIEQRHHTREIGVLSKNGERVSQVGNVGAALYQAAQKAAEAIQTAPDGEEQHG